jgi:hypothetical protein
MDVGMTCDFYQGADSSSAPLAKALAGLPLKRLGLHASSGGPCMYIPDLRSVGELHRTFYVPGGPHGFPLEKQVGMKASRRVTKLTLQVLNTRLCPSLTEFTALTQLVVADSAREFGEPCATHFALKGLEAVVGTLRHLTVSTNREQTRVELPRVLQLRSFVCVCSGVLILDCDAYSLGRGLGDVLLEYTSISGTGVRLAEDLGPRLGRAVLEVLGPQKLRQSLLFTRPGLVGDWWYGVFQSSKEQKCVGSLCCRVRV